MAKTPKPSSQAALSPKVARTPSAPSAPAAQKIVVKKANDYSSEGVQDHDIFLLPAADYQYMLLVTFLGAVVRLFRIYQPSSVVFDEVQYVRLSWLL